MTRCQETFLLCDLSVAFAYFQGVSALMAMKGMGFHVSLLMSAASQNGEDVQKTYVGKAFGTD